MRTRTLVAATLLVGAALAAGCSRCGRSSAAAADVRRFLPRSAELVVIAPEIRVIGDRLRQLQALKLASFAAQLQGLPSADAFADGISRQIGIDVRSAEALEAAGIASTRALGVALLPNGEALAVVPVSNPKAFRQALQKIARDRLGAGEVRESRTPAPSNREQIAFARPGGEPQLGYVLVDGFALVAAGAPGVAKLAERAALPEEASLAKEPRLDAALSRLPKERDLLLHAPPDARGSSQPLPSGATAVVRLEALALRAWVVLPARPDQKELAAFEKKDGPALLQWLPEDAFFVARFNGDPKALAPLVPRLVGPHLDRAFREAQFDIEGAVLSNVQPGAVASLSVSPQIPLGAGMPDLDVRRTNPFRYAHLVAIAQAKDAEKVKAVLAQMPQIAPKFGARVESVQKEGRALYVTSYARGEGVHFAQADGGRVVLASPLPRLERTLSANSPGKGPPLLSDPELSKVLSGHAFAAVVDLDALRASVKALPNDAWGIGGFAIKASAVRWLDATDDLRAITLGVSRSGEGLQAEIGLRLAKR